ncbi:MAG: hypothetical protein ACI4BC_04030 [Muribaculaceae bacterium]
MKKIYLFLALAIAVAVNANATYFFHVWTDGNCGKGELYNAVKDKAYFDDGTYYFDGFLEITRPEMFLIKEVKEDYSEIYYKASICIPNSQWSLSTENGENLVLAPGTYDYVTFNGTTLTFHGDNIVEYGYKLHSLDTNNGDNVLYSLSNKYLQKIADKKYELVFDSPIRLTQPEEFGFRNAANNWLGSYDESELTSWICVGGDKNLNMHLAPGTYYSVTFTEDTENGNYVKFNTYTTTSTGFDALFNKKADYVEIASTFVVSHHHNNFWSIYSDESSTYVEPTEEQKEEWYSDDPDNFRKCDWYQIYAPGDTYKETCLFNAGTIIEVSSQKAVRWSTATMSAITYTPNTYRVLNFNATDDEKERLYIFQPQEGEHVKVFGKFTKEGEQEYLCDEATTGVHKVKLLGYTSESMTVGTWYTIEGYVSNGGIDYISFKDETATGVESVVSANATVFAANGIINVNCDLQLPIEVYTANGQMLRAINADNASIAVAPGFYLVKVGNQVSKVVVK